MGNISWFPSNSKSTCHHFTEHFLTGLFHFLFLQILGVSVACLPCPVKVSLFVTLMGSLGQILPQNRGFGTQCESVVFIVVNLTCTIQIVCCILLVSKSYVFQCFQSFLSVVVQFDYDYHVLSFVCVAC